MNYWNYQIHIVSVRTNYGKHNFSTKSSRLIRGFADKALHTAEQRSSGDIAKSFRSWYLKKILNQKKLIYWKRIMANIIII